MDIDSLRKLTETPRDSAMLRLTLGRLLLENEQASEAEVHLKKAVELDAEYTAAWKELGRIRLTLGNREGAARSWRRGIEIARRNGDKQAEKEMSVFLKRLEGSMFKHKNPRPPQAGS